MASLHLVVELLEEIAGRRERVVIRDLAEVVSGSKSSIHRMLTALEEQNLIDRDEHGHLHLGARLLLIARKYEERWTLSPAAEAALDDLRDETLETVAIFVRVGYDRILLAAKESPQLLRCSLDPTRTWPLYKGSAGRLLLSMMPDRAIHEYLARLAATSEAGLVDEVLEQIADVREQGYSLGLAETVPGVGSISLPIGRWDGQPAAALTLVVPTARLDEKPLTHFLPLMRQQAQIIANSWNNMTGAELNALAGSGGIRRL